MCVNFQNVWKYSIILRSTYFSSSHKTIHVYLSRQKNFSLVQAIENGFMATLIFKSQTIKIRIIIKTSLKKIIVLTESQKGNPLFLVIRVDLIVSFLGISI